MRHKSSIINSFLILLILLLSVCAVKILCNFFSDSDLRKVTTSINGEYKVEIYNVGTPSLFTSNGKIVIKKGRQELYAGGCGLDVPRPINPEDCEIKWEEDYIKVTLHAGGGVRYFTYEGERIRIDEDEG